MPLAVVALAAAGCGGGSHAARTTDRPQTTLSVAPAGQLNGSGSASASTTGTEAVSGVVGTTGATGSNAGVSLDTLTAPFSAQSPWNTPVLGAPVDGRSAALISRVQERSGVVTSGSSLAGIVTRRRTVTSPLFINDRVWTDPIVFTTDGSAVKLECRQVNLPPPNNDCGDGWEIGDLAVPVTGYPLPSYDGWLTVIDEASGYAYDFWRARFTSNNTVLSYQFVRRWNLNGPGFLGPSEVSARGSGLPLFAGEILPHDVLSGRINHALAISLPGPASIYYVQPASSTDGNGTTNSLPEGARIRLRPGFDVSAALRRLPGRTNLVAARAIMQALKTYGAIVVDRSAVPTLYAVPDFNWNRVLRGRNGRLVGPDGHTPLPASLQNPGADGTPLLNGNVLRSLHVSDFQVIQLPQLQQFPPPPNTSIAGGLAGVAPQSVPGQTSTTSGVTSDVTAGGSSGAVAGGLIP